MELEEIRQAIDAIDSEIIGLLSKRGNLVSKAGSLKSDEPAVRDPERVQQIINKVKAVAVRTGLDPAIAEQIYRTVTDCFINNELQEFRGENAASLDVDKIKVYFKDDLSLKPNVPGAQMWAVGLAKTMMTYFELEPNTILPKHSHEAEQITMVMEGELTFVLQEKEITLKSGDVIAIPSNALHSAFTGNKPCKAVDAWSPVRKGFL
ncbi:MAG TPA: cupin domain-containing protein [Nitrospirae bacterium]|nr:cupin domain-containing protein [Nitrospirota bacterium]